MSGPPYQVVDGRPGTRSRREVPECQYTTRVCTSTPAFSRILFTTSVSRRPACSVVKGVLLSLLRVSYTVRQPNPELLSQESSSVRPSRTPVSRLGLWLDNRGRSLTGVLAPGITIFDTQLVERTFPTTQGCTTANPAIVTPPRGPRRTREGPGLDLCPD